MTMLQVFLLGMMVAYTPSLILLAITLLPTKSAVPEWTDDQA